MFNKVLVANRGEIAVRICRALEALNVPSVAIYAEDDRGSWHVDVANEAHSLGDGNVSETYINVDLILDVLAQCGADAVHPGYGFLSENALFAQKLEEHGIAFIGPKPSHLASFGLKHEARRLAEAANVNLLAGSGVLEDEEMAIKEAAAIGYPVMLKSSAGGGGIGMHRCQDELDLQARFSEVSRLAGKSFGDERLFVERCVDQARHVEVQAFGDGMGGIAILGDRDCSLQRRHQKVVEECPAPNLSDQVRERMHDDARSLLSSVNYQSAGTVEFLYDVDRQEATFLEVNTRLQVEHGVTELVYGVDLVRWMIALAAGELPPIEELAAALKPKGCAIELRVCAEDPRHEFRPTPGLLSRVEFPKMQDVRVDTWLRPGSEISPKYDSLIAKVMAFGDDREISRQRVLQAAEATSLHGVETNLDYLKQAVRFGEFIDAEHNTETLAKLDYRPLTFEVLKAGAQTTVQQWPGRMGYWHVGVPPSGPMDDLSFRVGNRMLGNDESASGLEITLSGPTLRFDSETTVLVAGQISIEHTQGNHTRQLRSWEPINLESGDTLHLGDIEQGARAYLLFQNGLDVPSVLGSSATFTLGQFGGFNGRALRPGDVLRLNATTDASRNTLLEKTPLSVPSIEARQVLHVTLGPHCTEDFLTSADLDEFLAAEWTVHYHSNRTGVRLIGPRPSWAREDGGEAGLHPSNIHDNAYAFGAIDFTGDMPVILGPDGPSLGGFVCPAAVIESDRWKLGQLVAGDKVNFVAVSESDAFKRTMERSAAIKAGSLKEVTKQTFNILRSHREDPIVYEADDICVRRAAQDTMLVEFGANTLDIELRLRIDRLESEIAASQISSIRECTPGIRSLLIRFDAAETTAAQLTRNLEPCLKQARSASLTRPSRVVHLPLSWNDPVCGEAIDRYMKSVREDAPWCPDNIEFIRRINGLEDKQSVKDIVLNADYLVMGLGDVYLGAPVATTVDPRHRLVTTKYNPARFWTAENSVGIGGAYMCIYGMEGPGGYQFVGRTVQVWNQYCRGRLFVKPWLLRQFDRIRFYEVDSKELLEMRAAHAQGALDIRIEDDVFELATYQTMLRENKTEIEQFQSTRRKAFDAELDDWKARGLLTLATLEATESGLAELDEDGDPLVASPLAGSVWSISVEEGQRIESGDVLFVVESMKTEFPVVAESSGIVGKVLVAKGQTVQAGQTLALAA